MQGLRRTALAITIFSAVIAGAPHIRRQILIGNVDTAGVGAATLFAFDDVSIPVTYNLELVLHRPVKYRGNPVVPLEISASRMSGSSASRAPSCGTMGNSRCGMSRHPGTRSAKRKLPPFV